MVAELTPPDTRAPEVSGQLGAAYRFDWGPNGLRALAAHADVVVIVDILRFTTAVCTALEAGATVLPYRWADDHVTAYATEHAAVVAGPRELGAWSLSPTDLLSIPAGTRLVLPSPNGSALAFAARDHGARHVLAGCLRNATATARAARRLAGPSGSIAVVAAGERWNGATGPLRVAAEDLLGAGAILSALDPAASRSSPRCSAEARAARAAFLAARPRLFDELLDTVSGRELLGRGWEDDVATCAALDVSEVVCLLDGVEFTPPDATRSV